MSITQFAVPANSPVGVEFTNTQNAAVEYTFTAWGTWTPNKNSRDLVNSCTAEGFSSLHSGIQDWFKQNVPDFANSMNYPKQTPYSLVAVNTTTEQVTQVGKKATIVLKPNETLRFILNNKDSDYANSDGSINVTWSSKSLVSKVLLFDGDGDYIALPSMLVNFSEGLTIEAWVYYEELLGRWSRIIELGNGCASSVDTADNILFCSSNSSKRLALSVRNRLGLREPETGDILEPKQWMHVAVTLDKSSSSQLNNCKYYKAGQEIYSAAIHLPDTVNRTKNYIGRSNWSVDPDFKGKMAEVRIWNKARTAVEIQADMYKRLTGKEPGLVACWPLNEIKTEGYAQKVADVTGNFPGTVTGTILVEDSTFPIR
jgi:hypothetical protein